MAPFTARIEECSRLSVVIQPKDGDRKFVRDFYYALRPGGVVEKFGIEGDRLVVVMIDGVEHDAVIDACPEQIKAAFEFIEDGRFSRSFLNGSIENGFLLMESDSSILRGVAS